MVPLAVRAVVEMRTATRGPDDERRGPENRADIFDRAGIVNVDDGDAAQPRKNTDVRVGEAWIL